MFDSKKELLDKIRLGEDSFIEFKEVRFAGQRLTAPHRNSLADELAAFANSRGGVLVLGVQDKSQIYRNSIIESRCARCVAQDVIGVIWLSRLRGDVM